MPIPAAVGRFRRRSRRGFTMLEVQVAFALLGIGLTGLCPLVVMQLRQIRRLEVRFQGQVVTPDPVTHVDQTMLVAKTYYIVPWKNPWARKLAGGAPILVPQGGVPYPWESPVNLTNPDPSSPTNDWDPEAKLSPTTKGMKPVKVDSIDPPPLGTGDDVTVHVDLSP